LLQLFAHSAQSAPALMSAPARAQPENYIVVTVANRPAVRGGGVGGTVRGYQGTGGYRASAAAQALVEQLGREHALSLVSEWPIEALQVHCVVFRIASGVSRDALLAALRSDRRVLIAQPMNEFNPASGEYDDPYATLQRNVRALDVRDAHRFSTGDGVRVAVIDTGIDLGHPELKDRVELGGNYVDENLEALRNDRHGTQVAGLIAAAANNGIGIVGIAPRVKVLAFKACWQDERSDAGRCNSFTLAQALAGAISARVQLINLSLVGPHDPLLAALVDKAVAAGVIVVGAAGTNGQGFPAALEHVIGVAESEAEAVDSRFLRAPGRDLVTLVPNGHYDFASGSSLSTAQVTGVIALLLERNRRLKREEVARILRVSMVASDTGGGQLASVNACRALAELDQRTACAVLP
jgi:subtilisin family serine protease